MWEKTKQTVRELTNEEWNVLTRDLTKFFIWMTIMISVMALLFGYIVGSLWPL